MAPPKNPPTKPAGKIRVTMSTGFKPHPKKAATGVIGAIGTVANAIADRVPTAQKHAERKMRGQPQGGAPRG